MYRWDGVRTVFQNIRGGRSFGGTYVYTITATDGRTVRLTQFWNDIAQLGEHINENVSLALLPATLTAIQRGQSVRFGDLMLSATGIAGQRKSVTWPEVSSVVIYNGYVRVDVWGKVFSLSTVSSGTPTIICRLPGISPSSRAFSHTPAFTSGTRKIRRGGRVPTWAESWWTRFHNAGWSAAVTSTPAMSRARRWVDTNTPRITTKAAARVTSNRKRVSRLTPASAKPKTVSAVRPATSAMQIR